jgi:replicative DNA helicase
MNNIELLKTEDLKSYIEDQTGQKSYHVGGCTYRFKKCPICGSGDHFNIDINKNLYNGFNHNCGGGSIIDFEMNYNNLDKGIAIKKLIEHFNYLENDYKKEVKSTEKKPSKTYKSVNLTPLFNQYYTSDENNLTYYFSRHIIDDDLGSRYLFIGGTDPKELFKNNLSLLPNMNNISDYETIIPVWENGKVVNCILRRNDKNSLEGQKTLNLKGCEVKLFNADYLKQSEKLIFITEGIFDCLSIECLGYKSICLNSVNMVNKLIELIKGTNCKSKFVLCGDNDKAGQNMNKKLRTELTKLNIESEILSFNRDYKDINDYYISNKESLKNEIEDIFKEDHEKELETFLKNREINKNARIISTGFKYIDNKFNGGLYPGLYCIGAISSLGKTALTLQIADNIAESGQPVLFFSLEMPKDELISRSLSRLMIQNFNIQVKTNDILYGYTDNCNDEFIKSFEYYRDRIAKNLKIIECNFDITHKNITNQVKEYIEKTGIKPVVFIDYLQIINISKDDVTEKRGIDNIVKALKQLSRDFKIPVFVVSSFNRDSYNTPVSYSSFKESGGIEYTSDFVLGLQLSVLDNIVKDEKDKITLHNKLQEAKKQNTRLVSLVILKNRNGLSNSIQPLKFYCANNMFLELEPLKELPTDIWENKITSEIEKEKINATLKADEERKEMILKIKEELKKEKELNLLTDF